MQAIESVASAPNLLAPVYAVYASVSVALTVWLARSQRHVRGALLLSLALMHFVNLYLFHQVRRRSLTNRPLPPVTPSGFAGPVATSLFGGKLTPRSPA